MGGYREEGPAPEDVRTVTLALVKRRCGVLEPALSNPQFPVRLEAIPNAAPVLIGASRPILHCGRRASE